MKNKRIIMNWILLIAWMILIFVMSNQPADISNKQSDLFINILSFIGIDLNSTLGSIASFAVRKTAHFTEYFILYWLAVLVFKNYVEIKKARIYSLAIVLGYAITDEVHQYFIPGREMAFRDVMIDFSGGLFGCLIDLLLHKFKNKKVNRNGSSRIVAR